MAALILQLGVLFLLSPIFCATPSSCPPKCHCTKHIVNCERQRLQAIPEGIPTSVTSLYLGYNLLDSLPPDAFGNLTNLKTLSLKNNLLLSQNVRVNCFRGLSNLKYIFLTGNKLTTLKADTFNGLTSLSRLYLTQNQLTEIPDLGKCTNLTKLGIDNNKLVTARFPPGFLGLGSLSTLVLSNNPLVNFTKGDVISLKNSPIAKIDLARCKLQMVDVDAFTVFRRLQSLYLSYNVELNIQSIQNVINGLRSSKLTYLGLSNVIRSSAIPANLFENFTQVPLRTLIMSHMEHVNVIQNGTFKYLPHLEFLDLSSSKLVLIHDNAFGTKDVKLTRLDLSHNALQVIPLDLPSSLEILDLSFNNPERLVTAQFASMANLRNLSLSNGKIKTVENDAFIGVSNLVSLDLSYNRLGGSNLGNRVFYPLINLKTLRLKGNLMTEIPTQSQLFSQQASLVDLDISDNHCKSLAPDIFSGLVSLQKLDLSRNNLGDGIKSDTGRLFKNLTKLRELVIENSYLSKLPLMVFQNLRSLSRLDLSHNVISEWEGGVFVHTANLTYLDLSHNSIAVINRTSVMDLPNNIVVVLTGNPFSCWCDLIWFRQWMTNTSRVSLPENNTYKCSSPKSMIRKYVLDFKPEAIHDECFPPPWIYIITGSVAGVTGLITALVVVLYRYRWTIRLKLYHMQKRWNRQKAQKSGYDAIPGEDEETQYDVFISYGPSEEDKNWVEKTLVPAIDEQENGKWKSFFEARDVMFNNSTIGPISDAIYHSRTVILVLSDAYLRDSRRDYEVKLVFESLEERGFRDNVIIPVILRDEVKVRANRLLRPLTNDGRAPLEWSDSPQGRDLFWGLLEDRIRGDGGGQIGNIQA